MEPDFCPFHVIKALAFSIIRINITETELTELSNGKRNQRSTPGGAEVKGLKSKVLSTPSVATLLVHPVSGGQSAGAVSV